MAASETEEIDVAKEFNLLPVIFETIQALQRTSDPQELTKKVSVELFSVICYYLVLFTGNGYPSMPKIDGLGSAK